MTFFRRRRSIKPLPGVHIDAPCTSEDPVTFDLKDLRPLGWVVVALIVVVVAYNVFPIWI